MLCHLCRILQEYTTFEDLTHSQRHFVESEQHSQDVRYPNRMNTRHFHSSERTPRCEIIRRKKMKKGKQLIITGSVMHNTWYNLWKGQVISTDPNKPSWEKAANIMRERYDLEADGRILVAKVDCTVEVDLCRRNHIQGYPSIRIFRKGSDVRDDHGHHDHESYYGDRDTDSLVKMMEDLVAPIKLESQMITSDNSSTKLATGVKRPAPVTGGCRIEGFVRVKKVPGNLVISARSAAHSFDASQMNMSHVISSFSFGKIITPKVMSDIKLLLPHLGRSHDRLNGNSYVTNPRDSSENVTIEHFLQVVKTEVMTRSYKLVEEYEYTAHSSLAHSVHIPVAKFHYEPSPMQVLITENPKSFSHFLTNICAIIGGVFTVAGILDSILHNTMRMMKKVELGKNF